MTNHTIAAISTPMGRGGIAVIRLSGSDAVEVAEHVFLPKSGRSLGSYAANSAVYGGIYEDDERIDDGIATLFLAPHSYTGENTVEISCHGGVLLAQTVLGAVLSSGAVMAGPGEFTRRAFVNGKLSLTQAESVIGLIDAESRAQMRLHAAQTEGRLSESIRGIHDTLVRLLSSIYAYIDFPDEDMTDLLPAELLDQLIDVRARLTELERTYKTGRAVAEGIFTVIAGRPNTGKSSLLNLLLGRDRAIVTPIAGTTRDTIEETAFAGPVMLRLCDTAGLRDSADSVERLGVARTAKMLDRADLILAIFDGSEALTAEDGDFLRRLDSLDCEKIALINKTDLTQIIDESKIAPHVGSVLRVCCELGSGREALIGKITDLFTDGDINYADTAIITNARQYASIKKASVCISDAISALNASITQDVAGLDVEHALTHLSEADGRQVTTEIVDSIFHNFCVGK